jgi:hypothetical protein
VKGEYAVSAAFSSGAYTGLSASECRRLLGWATRKGPRWAAEVIPGESGVSVALVTPHSAEGPTGPLPEWLILRRAGGVSVVNNLGGIWGPFPTLDGALRAVEAEEARLAPPSDQVTPVRMKLGQATSNRLAS